LKYVYQAIGVTRHLLGDNKRDVGSTYSTTPIPFGEFGVVFGVHCASAGEYHPQVGLSAGIPPLDNQ
jgi:hypothetical protein